MKKAGSALELSELAADATQNSPVAKTLPGLNPFAKKRGENPIRRQDFGAKTRAPGEPHEEEAETLKLFPARDATVST